jgi:hypothetical protein
VTNNNKKQIKRCMVDAEEPAKKRMCLTQDKHLLTVSTNPSFLKWEELDGDSIMKYGSRLYEKGKWEIEEKLLMHIFNSLILNAKHAAKYAKVMAAVKAGAGQGRTTTPSRATEELAAKGTAAKGGEDLIEVVDDCYMELGKDIMYVICLLSICGKMSWCRLA